MGFILNYILGALRVPSGLVLLIMNLIPLAGVMFFGWDVGAIIVLYWLESVVIGILNIPKILMMRKDENDTAVSFKLRNLVTAVFFTVHYGMFTGIHGVAVTSIFEVETLMLGLLSGGALMWTGFGFLLSHLFSFLANFIGQREYIGGTDKSQMFKPYARVIIMHLVVIFGALLINLLGSPIFALLLLIGIKTVIDLAAHSREHSQALNLSEA